LAKGAVWNRHVGMAGEKDDRQTEQSRLNRLIADVRQARVEQNANRLVLIVSAAEMES